jgi:hypothetical protein
LKVDITGEHKDQKRRRVCQFLELDSKLFNFIVLYKDPAYITDDIIIAKARSIFDELNIEYDSYSVQNEAWYHIMQATWEIRLS